MSTLDYLLNNGCPIRNNEYTPIAYSAAALSLATHIHPIQALSYVFTNEEFLSGASEFDTADETVQYIADAYDLTLYSPIGDLSGDFRLIGHLESLSNSLVLFMNEMNISTDEMNDMFEQRQIWEQMACSGKAWVSSGIDWTVQNLKDLC